MPGAGEVNAEDVWADKIKLGQISLLDVPVRPANDFEASGVENYAGTLGLYALGRMDLVVDGKNGFAYLPVPGRRRARLTRPSRDPEFRKRRPARRTPMKIGWSKTMFG